MADVDPHTMTTQHLIKVRANSWFRAIVHEHPGIRGSQCIWRPALEAARWRQIVVHLHHISSLDLKDVPLDDHLLELSFLHELGGCYPGVP